MELIGERFGGLAEADVLPLGDDCFNPTIHSLHIPYFLTNGGL
jgi:hypothetical protein